MTETTFPRILDSPCPVCGDSAPSNGGLTVRDHISLASFHIADCPTCGTRFINDPPTRSAIGSFYQNEAGDTMHRPPGKLFTRARQVRIRKDLQPLLNRIDPDDVVADMGAGDGAVARYLHSQGRPVIAFDIYPDSDWRYPEIGYRQLDLAHSTTIEPGGARGAVMRHVLEHVHAPVDTLKELRAAKVEHVLVIVPNVDSRLLSGLGASWYYWDPPRHLTFFSAESLGRAAESAGLRMVWSRTYGIDEIVTSAYRAARTKGRNGPWVRALRPTGILSGVATVAQTPFSNGVLQAVLSV